MDNRANRIVISWDGLPQYAARLIKSFIKTTNEKVSVIGTKPTVPIKGMEDILGQKIVWVNKNEASLTWESLNLPVPSIFIQSGWSIQPFIDLGNEVRSNGGIVIGLSDNNYRGNFRQFLGAIRFRIFLKKKFDGILVPGISAMKLMKYYGMSERCLRIGMYGADPVLFYNLSTLKDRPKNILFVGQFIKRKGILELCNAFMRLSSSHPDWYLQLYGDGRLKKLIPSSPNIIIKDFEQPEQIAGIFRNSRFLILPSIRESWGLVVHEAVSSGCALILSSAVGSIEDLATSKNSIIFKPRNEKGIYDSLKEAVDWKDEQYAEAQKESLFLSREFGPDKFSASLNELIKL
jgi:glycosyltransferase involved in cell wall biosynthesis